ncbi:hypothetical protein [Mycolicibacterium sp. CBMA 226]|uniref:hypothetical protein n=1 Tax=Mycolicibacterium sp. CBMA 226 TaxID=2606611 RepID=UPI0012DDDED2|nr:hypothetical protein [Mycolicibacterium sp. CBMA 226]MUL78792.1 hypothetical protein [Mycolicibacterium sp. CBMA 226]QGW61084.1 hypothetical protein ICEMyc226_00052 [Mycolicibacterium sp.]
MSTGASNADEPLPGEIPVGGVDKGETDAPQHNSEEPTVTTDPQQGKADKTETLATEQTADEIRAAAGITGQTPPVEAGWLVRLLTGLTWATWILIVWVGLFLAVGTGLFVWVAVRQDSAIAYDVITQHISPTDAQHPCFGLAEYLLGIFGFFVTPTTIGAVVAGIFVSNSTMSEDRVSKGLGWAARMAAKRSGKHRKEPGNDAPGAEKGGGF